MCSRTLKQIAESKPASTRVEAPFDDPHLLDSRKPLAQNVGERRLGLDRDHLRAGRRGKRGERADAGADVDHAPTELRAGPPEEPLVVRAGTRDVSERAVECLYNLRRLALGHRGEERIWAVLA